MKLIKYTTTFSLFFIINISLVFANNGIKLKEIEKNSKKYFVLYKQLSDDVYIDEIKYQKIKNKIDNFKDTNYMIYENFAYKSNNELTACNLINFNQNYITGIYLKRVSKNEKLDLYDDLVYEESYITYKNGQKINIRDAEFFKCGDLDIKDCNKTGNDGIECLKLLPIDCSFIVSSKNGSFCINLIDNKAYLTEYFCKMDNCEKLNNIVEYIYD